MKEVEYKGKKYKMVKEDYFGGAQPCCFSEMKEDPITHKTFVVCSVPNKQKFAGCKDGTCHWEEVK